MRHKVTLPVHAEIHYKNTKLAELIAVDADYYGFTKPSEEQRRESNFVLFVVMYQENRVNPSLGPIYATILQNLSISLIKEYLESLKLDRIDIKAVTEGNHSFRME